MQKLRYTDLPECDTWDTDLFVQKGLKKVRKLIGGYGSALCSVNGRVYDLDGHCWVRNRSGLYAVGSGSNFAMGALWAGASVQEALEIAAANDPYTGGQLFVSNDEEILDAS